MKGNERVLYRYRVGRPGVAVAGWTGMGLLMLVLVGAAKSRAETIFYLVLLAVVVWAAIRTVLISTVSVYPTRVVVHTVLRDHSLAWPSVRGFKVVTRRSFTFVRQHMLTVERNDGSTLLVAGFATNVRAGVDYDATQAAVDRLNEHRQELTASGNGDVRAP